MSDPTVDSLNGCPARVCTSGASSLDGIDVLPVNLGLLHHALRAARDRERDAEHAAGFRLRVKLRRTRVAALIVRARYAVPALAKVPFDAELRVLEQVFVDRVLAGNRDELLAFPFG